MKVSWVIKGSLAAFLAMAVAAAAQNPGMGPDPGPGMAGRPGFGMHRPPLEQLLGPNGAQGRWWNNPNVVDRLKLTDDQRKAMDDILLNHRKVLIDKRADVEKAELDLEPLIRDDQPNEGRILSQIDRVAQARAELEKANARFLLAVRGKLTPDQWKALQTWRSERMQRGDWPRRGERPKGPGRNDGPPPPPGAPGDGPQGMLNQAPGSDEPGPSPVGGDR